MITNSEEKSSEPDDGALMKKAIQILLLISVFISYGCHDTVELTRESVSKEKPSGDIAVWTRDGLFYQFAESKYWVVNDSIRGTGIVIIGGRTKTFKGSLALADIYDIKAEQFNGLKSVLLGAGITVAMGAVIAVLIVATSFSNARFTP